MTAALGTWIIYTCWWTGRLCYRTNYYRENLRFKHIVGNSVSTFALGKGRGFVHTELKPFLASLILKLRSSLEGARKIKIPNIAVELRGMDHFWFNRGFPTYPLFWLDFICFNRHLNSYLILFNLMTLEEMCLLFAFQKEKLIHNKSKQKKPRFRKPRLFFRFIFHCTLNPMIEMNLSIGVVMCSVISGNLFLRISWLVNLHVVQR